MRLKDGASLQGGKYRITETLGQGGFGITYAAIQTGLCRKVAVKEFFMKDYCERDASTSRVTLGTAGSMDLVDKFRQKFVREAQMIAGLDNPHIVRIYDIFEENGTAYYVMEHLGGGSLRDEVGKSGPLPERKALDYVDQICDALDYLHKRNTLHFDVKPSNILKTETGRLCLIDFGISKHYDESGSQTSSTPVGISKGYAPLEQYRQENINMFTPATDIYSLGATLFTLLTGKTPPEAEAVYEDGLPPMPSYISGCVWTAIEKSVSPRRRDRPQSIAEFKALLEGQGAPVVRPVEKPVDSEDTVLNPEDRPGRPLSPRPAQPAFATASTDSGTLNGHEWIDLGLSVKWASFNVGATKPEECGDYYAWGETETKSSYAWKNYKFRTSGNSYRDVKFSKYVTEGSGRSYGIFDFILSHDKSYGTVDNKTVLDPEDDVAHVKWGGDWRMPTTEDFKELINNCTWTWTTLNGVKGYRVTSKKSGYTSRSIFLPAAGWRLDTSLGSAGEYGYYWSSSLDSDDPLDAWYLYFNSGGRSTYNGNRRDGLSVRPVCP